MKCLIVRAWVVLLASTIVPACGGGMLADASADSGADSARDSGPNSPPAWIEAPATLMVGQGQHATARARWRDPDGDMTVHSVTAPMGVTLTVDGSGEDVTWKIFADYAVQGEQRIEIRTTDARGASTTHLLTLTVRPIRWLRRIQWTADPEPREHGAMFIDTMSNEIVTLAGSGYMPYGSPLADAWRLDLMAGTWRSATVAGDPLPAGGSRRLAQIDNETGYLWGGYPTLRTNSNELFRLTTRAGTTTVQRITQTTAPGARALHAFAFDPMSRRFALFGGVGSATIYEDTWIMTLAGDTPTWRRISTPDMPTGRYGMFTAFDEVRGRLIVWSGAQGFDPLDPARDAWALDVRADPPVWRQLTTGDEPGSPTGRRNGCAVYDPTGPRLFIFGGTADARTSEPGLWALDLEPGSERWYRVEIANAPPVRSSGFGIFDPRTGQVYMGFGNSMSAAFRDLAVLGY